MATDKKQLEEGPVLKLDFKKLKQVSAIEEDVLPVVVQDSNTREVLIMCYVNETAIERTIETGIATFWSTSRNDLWIKGATSGDTLRVEEIRVNCEQNSLLYLVTPLGQGACHTKKEDGRYRKSCYYRLIGEGNKLRFPEKTDCES